MIGLDLCIMPSTGRGPAHDRLGHPRRPAPRPAQRRDPAQGHHHERVPRAPAPVRHGAAQARQSRPLLRLPVEGLLRLAAGRGARPPRGADRRDHAGTARAEALRARAARSRGRTQPLRPARRFPARRRVQAPGLFRPRPRRALRAVRPAAVRLVPLPGAGSDRRSGHLAVDRPHPAAQHHPARQRRRRVFPRVAAQSHQARVARSQGALGRQIRSRGAVRSEREREDGAVVAELDQAFRPHRRKDVGRRRTDHQAPARRTRRIRRPVHPRNHVDRQSHLPLRPPRLAGGHAGHRRSDLDDPLHQQSLFDGAVAGRTRCRRRPR